jgi:hypothetical protein
MTLSQSKVVASGGTRSWEVDLEAMKRCARWARGQAALLENEVSKVLAAFPTFIAALGAPLGQERCWVEAHEPVLCPDCRELVVFDRGTRCASCERVVDAPSSSTVGFVGRIPALISKRPFERALDRRIEALRREGSKDLNLFLASVIAVGEKRYLTPRFGMWLSKSHPHADPPVMVWPEYFKILDIPPDHVYYAGIYYRLCLYATWHEQPAVEVLRNRVAPRLLIDLMVADLKALGKLDAALEKVDCSLYELYNVVGRPAAVQPFQEVYEEMTRPDEQGAGR